MEKLATPTTLHSPPSCTTTDDDNDKANCNNCCKCATAICFIIAIFILGLLHGKYSLSNSEFPKFDIDSLTVSNFNLSDPSLTSHWNISMNFTNFRTAKLSFEFSSNYIWIYYETPYKALWQQKLIRFNMNTSQPTVHLDLDFWESSDTVDDRTRKTIGENIANNGTVRFYVHFTSHSKIMFKNRRVQHLWWDPVTYIEFKCEVQLFSESSEKMQANTLISDSEKCKLVTVFHL
ncbi:hypothetical protein POM88_047602 [Heracleum sosnowskyi]|uniref:Late embryogenesis abundant protein LEA-2 subgroup domain-containing protein n=1 Tax=Heracleum sosnowskyi TaxID=360622 RepID=A0AAD8LYX0_9APIA|nr:hypothetical protein POM88_047602 [Heracleum sosnowskyi]